MKAFIEKVFKMKKLKEDQATEAMVESIIEDVKEEVKEVFTKPKHFPDCNCFKCVRWKNQSAK